MSVDRIVALRDGRQLSSRHYGASRGPAILYFHGWPGSRIEAELVEDAALDLGTRVLAIDRPGCGLSDFQPRRKILDWAADIEQMADQLRLDRFSVVGVSGGSPYALACAARLGDRLSNVAVVSGMGPIDDPAGLAGMNHGNRWMLALARYAPWISTPLLAPFGWMMKRNPALLLSKPFLSGFAEVDQEALRQRAVARALTSSMAEAFRQGAAGPAWDGRLYARPWGFQLGQIASEVHLWHGGVDRNVPPAMFELIKNRLPKPIVHYFPEEGHLSLAVNHHHKILEALTTTK